MDSILASGQRGRALPVVTSCFSEFPQEVDVPFEKQKSCCSVLHLRPATGRLPTERSSPALAGGVLRHGPPQRWLGCVSVKVAFWLSRRTPVRWFSTCGSQAGRTALSRVVAGNVDLLQQETPGRGPAAFNDAPGEAPWSPRATVLNPEVTQAADGSECRGLLAGEFAGSPPRFPGGLFELSAGTPLWNSPRLEMWGPCSAQASFMIWAQPFPAAIAGSFAGPNPLGGGAGGQRGRGGAWVSLNSAF